VPVLDTAVRERYGELLAALGAGDRDTTERLTDPRLIATDPRGTVLDQAGVLAAVGQPPPAVAVLELEGFETHPHADAVIVRGGFRDPTDDAAYRLMGLFVPGPDGPRLAAHHYTRCKADLLADMPPADAASPDVPGTDPRDAALAQSLEDRYHEIHEATRHVDVDALAALIDDDWFTTDPAGELRRKPDYLVFAREMFNPGVAFGLRELVVRGIGDTAVVSCRYLMQGRLNPGVDVDICIRVSGIWSRACGPWLYAAQQGSFIG
jgi:ketosteroid isomerase-like protein